jgi:hypothetical protein
MNWGAPKGSRGSHKSKTTDLQEIFRGTWPRTNALHFELLTRGVHLNL